MISRSDIKMRDPYVYVKDGAYYLYGTTDADCWHGRAAGFQAYKSRDLETFEALGSVFAPSPDFWGTENFWAPEMHAYQGAYYLFASFKTEGHPRATAILKADNPEGPFMPHGAPFVTPEGWECLDGTLYIDKEGKPWVVFCHEWVQVGDGEICARRLKDDLSGAIGEAITLFRASEAKWAKKIKHSSGIEGYVTDGPFMVYPKNGGLWMLWSSLCETGYAIGLCKSESGDIKGPWRQQDIPLFSGDGGHGMVFTDLEGKGRLAIHTPNKSPDERPVFPLLQITEDGLEIK